MDAPPAAPRFSAWPTDEEITRARVFLEPLVPVGPPRSPGENRALAEALSGYVRGRTSGDLARIVAFLASHPGTGWRPSLLANLGSVWRHQGRFSRALEAWTEAWELTRDDLTREGRLVADRVLGDLLDLQTQFGRMEDLEALLAEVEAREFLGSTEQKVSLAREGLWVLRFRHEEALPSGRVAVEQLVPSKRAGSLRESHLAGSHATPEGANLLEIQALAASAGLDLRPAIRAGGARIPIPAIVHLEIGHYSAVVESDEAGVVLRDPVLAREFRMSAEALADEASGYFLIPRGPLPRGWRDARPQEAERIRGKCHPIAPDPEEYKPCDITTGDCGGNPGMAGYAIHKMLVSLTITDTPLWYTPPRGPAVQFAIAYNQRDSFQPQVFSYSNLGPRWTFNWLSYVTESPSTPTVYVSGGGQETYSGTSPHSDSGAILVQTSASPLTYERRFPDDSVQVFGLADTGNPRKIFMTGWIDPQGHSLTYTYDANYRLVAVTDAIGQVTTLSYQDVSDPLKVTQVTDPFGRAATFTYDSQGRLIRAVDMGGLASEFTYKGTGGFIEALETPYGTTAFRTSDEFTSAGNVQRHVEATDPEGGTERAEYYFAAMINDGRKTYYWNKRAMDLAPGQYDKAEVTIWKLDIESTKLAGNPESVKQPLEGAVTYTYLGENAWPITISRALDDGPVQTSSYDYGLTGSLLRAADPLGRETVYEYDPSGIDLLRVKQKNPASPSGYDLLAGYTYDTRHLPLTVTDASGKTTTYTYTPEGQLETATNAKNEAWTFAYDGDGYLQTVTGPLAGAVLALTWDGYGRPRTLTNADNYTVTVDYDPLDRPTRVTYPNGTYEQLLYEKLHPQRYRDLKGRWTTFFADRLKRLTAVQDPAGRVVTLEWCDCGSLEALIDANGNATRWIRDLQGRVTSEVRADGRTTDYVYEIKTSRLKQVVDAKGQRKNYTYFADDLLKQISYTNAAVATPSVSFTYDPVYGRVATRTDGTGVTTYGYNPVPDPPAALGAARLASIDGPLANDVIEYGYDELGRVTERRIDGVPTSVLYDALGRITNTTNVLGAFTYDYDGATSRVTRVAGPNGLERIYGYFDASGDRQLREIRNQMGGTLLSRFTYTYGQDNNIATWTQEQGTDPAKRYEFTYDPAQQLTGALLKDASSGTLLKRYSYAYDAAGNRTSEQIDDAVVAASHNQVNELTQLTPGGALTFAGTTDEPATVTVQGSPAVTTSSNTFEGQAPVGPGLNTVTVTATDPSGNQASRSYEVTLSGEARTLTYDANGNLTSDGVRSYEWDASDRLVAINEGTHRTEFQYDGLWRRVRVVEKEAGATVSDKRLLWCGGTICEERDQGGGTTTKRYSVHGFHATTGAHLYTGDHLDSVREVVDSDGDVRARYDYDPWGRKTKVSGDRDTDSGFTGHYSHAASGMHLALYRGYHADLGRWISGDPIGLMGGINLFAYGGNDPVNEVDPLGLSFGTFARGFVMSALASAAIGLVAAAFSPVALAIAAGVGLAMMASALYEIHTNNCLTEDEIHEIVGGLLGGLVGGIGGAKTGPRARGRFPGNRTSGLPNDSPTVGQNRAVGNALRDEVATGLRQEGRNVATEVSKDTPFGRRDIDIEVQDGAGDPLGGIETKAGDSPYTPSQRAKDNWLKMRGYPVNVVRAPKGWCPPR